MVHFNSNEKKILGEMFCTDKFATENGYEMAIEYYDNSGQKTKKEYFDLDKSAGEDSGRLIKSESFYSGKNANDNGYYEEINYYDSEGKTTKLEIFYTDIFARKKGFNSVVIKYRDGTPTSIENYMNGKLVKKSSVSGKQNKRP